MTTAQAPQERLLTPAEVAALVYVDPKTVSRWADGRQDSVHADARWPPALPPVRRPGTPVPATRSRSGPWRHRESCAEPWRSGPRRRRCDRRARPVLQLTPSWRGRSRSPWRDMQRTAARGSAGDSAASVAVAAETVAAAAAKARRTRACAAAEAAKLVATEAAGAAAAMRSRATAQAGCLAETAAQAKRLALASSGPARTTSEAVLMAATVQAAADAASSDTELAAARVAQAVTDAAAHVAVMVAAFDLSLERETSAAAEALHNLTVETARHVAQTNRAVTPPNLIPAKRPHMTQRVLPPAQSSTPAVTGVPLRILRSEGVVHPRRCACGLLRRTG